MKPWHRGWATCGVVLLALPLGGCSEEAKNEVKKVVKKAQATVAQTVDTAAEQVNSKGSVQLEMEPKLSLESFAGKFVSLGEGRPNVIFFNSTPPGEAESFPSVYFKAETSANAPEELQGQTLKAQLFIQREKEGPILYTTVTQPVEVSIKEVKGGAVAMSMAESKLITTASRDAVKVKGEFFGILAKAK